MAEHMTIYQPGDQFATLSATGRCQVWRITSEGTAEPHPGYHPQPPLTED